MNIRPCDLTNEQWLALRRQSEQKAAPAKPEAEPEPVNTNQPGCWRNGRFIPFQNTPGDTSKWDEMGDAARKQRNTAFTNDQIRNRGTE
jgi:hypothetical protein